ncbi:hypothetical protein [Streptomyces sp. KN37]|uniref:hypothetical protein n=1 Tax=Streptomyces sp. KN37 TaxID=3090667 RepID=UPI002A765E34|nr:hypothetical protein [Streptomyces sp. KN37]WPO73865.1 hypothetical protein R9806_26195 [Streptomyces sp. KN37]
MVQLAAAWYESEAFWTITVGGVVAMAVGTLGAWATLRSANPKRRMTYCQLRDTSLLSVLHSDSDIEVRHSNVRLEHPRIVDVEIANTGRRDIPASMFHAGEPISFDLGAPIIAVLSSVSFPFDNRVPAAEIEGQEIRIGPGLLAKRQRVTFSLLVDGRAHPMTCQHSLVDVDVRRRSPEDDWLADRVTQWRVMALSTVAIAATAIYTVVKAFTASFGD